MDKPGNLSQKNTAIKEINVVLTSQLYYREAGDAIIVNDLEQFINNPENFIAEEFNEIFVIGGESLYAKVMTDYIDFVDKVFVTEIYNEFNCDTFAPKFHKMVGESLQYTRKFQ